MIRVAILKSGLGRRGGLEKYTEYTARAFAERGCDVTILTSTPRDQRPKHIETDYYRALTLGPRSWLGFKHRLQFDRWCRKWLDAHPPDIIFGMDRNTYQTHYRVGEGCHAAYLERRRTTEPWTKTVTFRLNPLHRVNLWLEKKTFLCPKLKRIFTNSHMVEREVLDHYPVDPEKISVIHNGVEWHEMERDFSEWEAKRPELVKAYGLDPNRRQLLFAGHGWRRKGLAYLLDALPKDRCQLVVVGREKRAGKYLKQMERLRLGDAVVVLPQVPSIRELLQIADCCVIPSVYDPFANVTVEALAMGVPVITTPYNGAKEILTPKTGTVLPSLTEGFRETLEAVEPKTPDIAKHTRQSVAHLDFSSQLTKMIDLTLGSL